jgi:hypothetical protein
MAREQDDPNEERGRFDPEAERLRGVGPDEEELDDADESDEEDLDEEEESTL